MTGANVPRVSLQRTLTILLILYSVAVLLALIAGGMLLAHVDPYGECILFSEVGRDGKFYYGSEYICDAVGGFFIIVVFGAFLMFFVAFKYRRNMINYFKSGEVSKGEAALTISNSIVGGHAAITCVVLILTIVLTAGYQETCSNLGEKVNQRLRDKINQDPTQTRGEKIDERFVDDNQFWRYTGKIGNPFGSEIFEVRIDCRTIFTDPMVHQELHDNHVERYANYFGYWYKQDLYSYNSQLQSVLTNTLLEASLAGAWLSVLLWLSTLIFMVIQKYYIKREKWAGDKLSLHSGFNGSMRKYEGSVFSGESGYYGPGGHNSTMSRPGTATLVRGAGVRGSMDDLALSLAGVTAPLQQPQGPSPYPTYPQHTEEPTQQYHHHQQQRQQPMSYHQYQDQPQSHNQSGFMDRSEVETEIM